MPHRAGARGRPAGERRRSRADGALPARADPRRQGRRRRRVRVDRRVGCRRARPASGHELDTVVYACCDMLNACELAGDVERAAQWCRVADDFADTYGCPYPVCRMPHLLRQRPDRHRTLARRRTRARRRPADHRRRVPWIAQPGAGAAGRTAHPPGPPRGCAAGARRRRSPRRRRERVAPWRAALALARGDAAAASATARAATARCRRHRSAPRRRPRPTRRRLSPAGDRDAAATAATRRPRRDRHDQRPDRQPGCRRGGPSCRSPPATRRRRRSARNSAQAAGRMCGFPYELARARFELGRAHAGLDDAVAVGHARHALDAFDELGATVDADRAAAFLRSLGVNTGPRPKAARDVLTSREEEVLGLLGTGVDEPGDRRPAPRQPQDGLTPRQQHPHQAQPAQSLRGRRLLRSTLVRTDEWAANRSPARCHGPRH